MKDNEEHSVVNASINDGFLTCYWGVPVQWASLCCGGVNLWVAVQGTRKFCLLYIIHIIDILVNMNLMLRMTFIKKG